MATLLIKTKGLERTLDLHPGVNRIGRDAHCDLPIEEDTISSTHCEVVVAPGGVMVRDCGSTNGTRINGNPIQEARLLPGQTMQLGQVELFVENIEIKIPAPATPPPVNVEPKTSIPEKSEVKVSAQTNNEVKVLPVKIEAATPIQEKIESKTPALEKVEVKVPAPANGELKIPVPAKLESKPPFQEKAESKSPVSTNGHNVSNHKQIEIRPASISPEMKTPVPANNTLKTPEPKKAEVQPAPKEKPEARSASETERKSPKAPNGIIICPRHAATLAVYKCAHCNEPLCGVCVRRLREPNGRMILLCEDCVRKHVALKKNPAAPSAAPPPPRKSIFGFLRGNSQPKSKTSPDKVPK